MKRLRKKAALYLRTATRGKSMKKQRFEMEKFCARWDWVIASVYVDDGYSGIKNDRPGLKKMLRDAAKGEFSVVVVWDVSRLTRSISDLSDILYFLKIHGVGFCVATIGRQDMEHNTGLTHVGRWARLRLPRFDGACGRSVR